LDRIGTPKELKKKNTQHEEKKEIKEWALADQTSPEEALDYEKQSRKVGWANALLLILDA